MDSDESGTPGKAGGLPCAGPSKGPDRTRGPNTPNVCTPFRLAVVFESTTRHIQKNTLPELSNSGSPPAEPGVYLREIILYLYQQRFYVEGFAHGAVKG